MPGILTQVRSTMPGTWVGHGLVCLALLGCGIAVGAAPGNWTLYTALAVLALLGVVGAREDDWRLCWIWVGAVAVLWLTGATGPWGGVCGSGAGVGYYLLRERADKRAKLRDGRYDERARIDRVGDLLASVFVHAAAWAMYGASLL
jgi:hypothetical protein